MSDILKQLLGAPDTAKLPTRAVEIPRLSTPDAPFVLTLRTLPYGKAQQIRESAGKDSDLRLILASCPELQAYKPTEQDIAAGIASAEDLLKKKLLWGEISAIVSAIDKLNGCRAGTIKEVKN